VPSWKKAKKPSIEGPRLRFSVESQSGWLGGRDWSLKRERGTMGRGEERVGLPEVEAWGIREKVGGWGKKGGQRVPFSRSQGVKRMSERESRRLRNKSLVVTLGNKLCAFAGLEKKRIRFEGGNIKNYRKFPKLSILLGKTGRERPSEWRGWLFLANGSGVRFY